MSRFVPSPSISLQAGNWDADFDWEVLERNDKNQEKLLRSIRLKPVDANQIDEDAERILVQRDLLAVHSPLHFLRTKFLYLFTLSLDYI